MGLLNLKGVCIDDELFLPVAITLLHFVGYLESLDLGENPLLTDRIAGKYLV